jgi:outer membrane lipopolysaccharide assembly protein LptE/RlpB
VDWNPFMEQRMFSPPGPTRYALRAMRYAFCALFLVLSSCGYHLRPSGEPVGWSVDSLAIPMMTSTSSVVGFESDFTRIVRDEFISHAKVPLTAQEEARYVLVGRIHDIRTDPQSYSYLQQTVQGHDTTFAETNRRRLTLTLSISMVEKATGKVVWSDQTMMTRASYDVGADPLVNQYNQRLALEKVARRLAQQIYMRTMERF